MSARRPLNLLLLSLAVFAFGCRSRSAAGTDPGAPTPAASASGLPEIAFVPEEEVRTTLNPDNQPVYSGPIGSVRGIVRVSGDAPPTLTDVLAKIPAGTCEDARAFYGKLFREGPNRELGDVLVAVTNYKGYVPPATKAKLVTTHGCAFGARTIASVFGQVIDIANRGTAPFIPELVGAHQPALLAAVPGGDPVPLFAPKVGQYMLIDHSHLFATADVFVLRYPTVDVTGLDGKFHMEGIPAGDVVVTAYLPATGKQASQHLTISAGDTATLDLTIPFSLTERTTQPPPAPEPSASP